MLLNDGLLVCLWSFGWIGNIYTLREGQIGMDKLPGQAVSSNCLSSLSFDTWESAGKNSGLDHWLRGYKAYLIWYVVLIAEEGEY